MILEAAALPVYAASWLLYIATLSAFRLAGCLLWSRTLAGSGNRFVVRGPGAVEANDCQIQHIWAEAGEMVRVSDSFRTGWTGYHRRRTGGKEIWPWLRRSVSGLSRPSWLPAQLWPSATKNNANGRRASMASIAGATPRAPDSAGAAMGSVGLMKIAWWAWELLPEHRLWLTIASATFLWSLVWFAVWWLWKRNFPHRLVRSHPSRKNSGTFKSIQLPVGRLGTREQLSLVS